MAEFGVICGQGMAGESGPLLPLDIDVHGIPARGAEPAHAHHDIRYLLVAAEGQSLAMSEESTDLAWFDPGDLTALGADASLIRLGQKASALLDAPARSDRAGR